MILAFWTWGQFITSGNVPYLALPSIGWDTYGRSGRGYVQGRFRGTNMVYGESEFRMPISRNGLFGAVAFINATTASNPTTGQTLFNALAPRLWSWSANKNEHERQNKYLYRLWKRQRITWYLFQYSGNILKSVDNVAVIKSKIDTFNYTS